jgi:hypothetical protein
MAGGQCKGSTSNSSSIQAAVLITGFERTMLAYMHYVHTSRGFDSYTCAGLTYFLALMFAAFKLRAVVCDLALLGSHIQPTWGTSNSLSTIGPSALGFLLAQVHRLSLGTSGVQLAAAEPAAAAAGADLLPCILLACMASADRFYLCVI